MMHRLQFSAPHRPKSFRSSPSSFNWASHRNTLNKTRITLNMGNMIKVATFVTIPPNFSPPPKDFEIIDNLSEWLEENDGSAKNCFVGVPKSTGRRGLFTKSSASPGDLLLKIPSSFIIAKDRIMSEPIGPLLPFPSQADFEKLGESRLRQQMLACFGLYLLNLKKQGNSFFEPWVKVLPAKVHNCLDFPESLLKELNNTSVALITNQMRSEFDKTYENVAKNLFKLYPHAFPTDYFTKDGLRWGVNMAWSRAINSDKGPLMIPFMDFANHPDSYRGQNSHFAPAVENGELIGVLTATKFIKANQEIFVDYGARSNSALFNVYGFIQDNNPEDELFMKISTFTLQLSYHQVQTFPEFLEKTTDFIMGPNQMLLMKVDQSPDSLIKPLRALWIWKNQHQQSSLSEEGPFPPEQEKQFLDFVITCVTDELERFKTTIKKDEELLTGDLEPMMRNCVKIRLSEKKILQGQIDNIEQMKASLDSKGSETVSQ